MSIHGLTWVLPGELAGMPMPACTAQDAVALRQRGVGALVNLTRRSWPERALAEAGLAYLWLPIADFRPPTPGQVDDFVRLCDAQVGAGRAVAVHCLAGRGRTGTMIACYLVHRGMAAAAAIERVRRARAQSVETREQERAVHRYEARRAGR